MGLQKDPCKGTEVPGGVDGEGHLCNMVTWMHWVSHGQSGGHMQVEYRYWMTYADMEIAPGFKPKNAFNPDMDYAKPQDSSAPKDGMSEP